MAENLTATASTTINAPAADVWDALVTPEAIRHYMFGAQVVSDWREGSNIVWKGEWQGKAYEDKGIILKYEPDRVLQYSHFSPLSGAADVQENYHTVTIKLDGAGEQTRVVLTQDKNASEEAREHSRKNWEMMLQGLKKYVED
jgi:uncharacterized protein YndB with AHSA1/START domain